MQGLGPPELQEVGPTRPAALSKHALLAGLAAALHGLLLSTSAVALLCLARAPLHEVRRGGLLRAGAHGDVRVLAPGWHLGVVHCRGAHWLRACLALLPPR